MVQVSVCMLREASQGPGGGHEGGSGHAAGLGNLRRKVKTWLVFNKHSNMVMLDPLATFKASSDAAAAMMADTVHLRYEGYKAVDASSSSLTGF
jgi:hypothetical protein